VRPPISTYQYLWLPVVACSSAVLIEPSSFLSGCGSRGGLDGGVLFDGRPFFEDTGVNDSAVTFSRSPAVQATLPSCPRTTYVFDAGTPTQGGVDVQIEASCSPGERCEFYDTIPCYDAGVTWNTATFCGCLNGQWSCGTDDFTAAYCAPSYSCPDAPLLQSAASDGGELLPRGPCHNGDDCLVRTREQCQDGSTGITSAHACGCAQSGLATWQCDWAWSTAAGCAGEVADASASRSDAGAYWIHVEGDGNPYDLTDSPVFFNPFACASDATLSGCFASHLAPCLDTAVSPGSRGSYFDRNGDLWTLTSTSIQAASPQGAIGGPIAEGTLEVAAMRPDGTTTQLRLTFHAAYKWVTC